MKKLIPSVLATLLFLSCLGSALAADKTPLIIDAGKTRSMTTGETVSVTHGGTGGTTQSAARSGLGLGTFATQDYATPPAIGGTTPAAGAFSTLSATGNLTTNVTGSTQCLHVNSSGVVSGVGADCGTGSASPITYKDEGSTLTAATTSIDCVGASITCTNVSGAVTVTMSGAGVSDGDKGDITVSSSGATYTIDNTAVSLAKIANASANSKLLGAGASGSGASYAEITLGTNLSMSGTTLNATGGGSSKPFITFRPFDNEAPSATFATLDTRNGHVVLEFDTTTSEAAIFSGVMPTSYAGGNIIVSVYAALDSATSGTLGWLAAIERIDVSSLDIDADSFASDQTITATTVPGTSGQILKLSVTITAGSATDNIAAGEAFRLRIKRDTANDTATGDAQLIRVTLEEA